MSLAYSCCAPSWECPFPAAHWNGTGDLPPAAPRQRERLKQLPHGWCQTGEISLPSPHSQCLQDSPREGRARQVGFGIVSRGACRSAPGSCPAPLSPTEQVKTHLAERHRAPRGNLPGNSMKTGTARAEVTCECSLQRWHSGKVLGTSSVLTRHRRIHTREGGGHLGHPPQPTQKVCAPRTRALALFE